MSADQELRALESKSVEDFKNVLDLVKARTDELLNASGVPVSMLRYRLSTPESSRALRLFSKSADDLYRALCEEEEDPHDVRFLRRALSYELVGGLKHGYVTRVGQDHAAEVCRCFLERAHDFVEEHSYRIEAACVIADRGLTLVINQSRAKYDEELHNLALNWELETKTEQGVSTTVNFTSDVTNMCRVKEHYAIIKESSLSDEET